MTATAIYRISCDAPSCPATNVVENISDVPERWTRINSAAHLENWRPGGMYKGAVGRARKDPRSQWDILSDAFKLHLCPEHPNVFAGHLPQTEGTTVSKRGDRTVLVSCSCGAGWRVTASTIIISGAADFDAAPRYVPEAAWWRHLPEELQEYAGRTRRLVAKQDTQ